MEGDPGSMSAYTLAERVMFPPRPGPGPAAYDTLASALIRCETVAPFDTSNPRGSDWTSAGPGPAAYLPIKRDLRQTSGSPLFRWGERFKDLKDWFQCIEDPRLWSRIPDPWTAQLLKYQQMNSKRPRVSYDKFVSTCAPTIYHPLDVRCFLKGLDGRFYPWRLNRREINASPASYNTFYIHTSLSKLPPKVDFGKMSERKDPRRMTAPGPFDHVIPRSGPFEVKGGEFLGKHMEPPPKRCQKSEEKHLDFSMDLNLPSDFDKASPKAVLAPFKEPIGGPVCRKPLPGPSDHFRVVLQEEDLEDRLVPGIISFPPCKPPFESTEERFVDLAYLDRAYLPGPADYDILTSIDILLRDAHRKRNRNCALAFGSTSQRFKKDKEEKCQKKPSCRSLCNCPKHRGWRNLRPKTAPTYGYFGAPTRIDSPGPIYDTHPGNLATLARKSWLDSRNPKTPNGFLNSGCPPARKTGFPMDLQVPGPGKYYAKGYECRRVSWKGAWDCPGPRFQKNAFFEGPGPVHKLHEKYDSSVWRASHLGSFNCRLKAVGAGGLRPTAGGFVRGNLNQVADSVWGIVREDDYKDKLCPNTFQMEKRNRPEDDEEEEEDEDEEEVEEEPREDCPDYYPSFQKSPCFPPTQDY